MVRDAELARVEREAQMVRDTELARVEREAQIVLDMATGRGSGSGSALTQPADPAGCFFFLEKCRWTRRVRVDPPGRTVKN